MAEKPFSDSEAVRRLRSGEEEALVALYDRYAGRVFRFAIRLLATTEDAEEVVADTFLQAFRQARSYRAEGSFSGWLFRIARNLCYGRLRRQPHFHAVSLEELPQDDLEATAIASPETALVGIVREALAQLPPDYRRILTLCELEGLSNAEAALALGRSVAAAKSLHFRARQALRDAALQRLKEEE